MSLRASTMSPDNVGSTAMWPRSPVGPAPHSSNDSAPARVAVTTFASHVDRIRAVADAAPDQPVIAMRPATDLVRQTMDFSRLLTQIMGAFAGLAILLTAIGIYGLLSFYVARRTHEIGIRMALGAKRGDVLKMIVGQGMVLTLAGVGIGIVGALALTRFISSFLYGVKASDPATFFAVALLLGGVALSPIMRPAGTVALGTALAGLALWLMRQDVARRTVKTSGLPRFIAVCLLSGYVWLAIGASTILVLGGLAPAGPGYDAALHAVLLGFVFSMVFGHAPIILPAVLRVAVPYSPYFYAPLALLHASLVIRLTGDWMALPQWRAWGGALNGFALLAFVLGTIAAVIAGGVGGRARVLLFEEKK